MAVYEYGEDVCESGSACDVNYIDSNTPMESGKYYEAVYNVSGIRTVFPGWEQDCIDSIVSTVESNPGCYVQYIHLNPDNTVRVQWLYDYVAYAESMRASGADVAQPKAVPVVVWVVVAAVLSIIALWLISVIVGQIKEIVAEGGEELDIMMWAVLIVAISILCFAIVYALRGVSETFRRKQ